MTHVTNQLQNATINDIKPLTVAQYDKAKTEAEAVLRERTGDQPKRRDFTRDRSPIWSLWDLPAAIIMAAALLLSTAHIMSHMGKQAIETYPTAATLAGDLWDVVTYGRVHQYAALAMSEAAVLLFVMLFKNVTIPSGKDWGRKVGPVSLKVTFLILAVGAAVFVFNANLQSGVGWLESVLPPALTLGLGLYLETKLAASMREREAITAEYREALHSWREAQRDITTHNDYRPTLRKILAERLQTVPHNQRLTIPQDVLALAVARELYKDEIWQRSDRAEVAQIARLTRDGEARFMPAAQPVREAAPVMGKDQPQLGDGLQLGTVPVMPSRNGNGTNHNGNGSH